MISSKSSESTAQSGREEWRRSWPAVPLTAIGMTCAPAVLPVYTIGVFVAPLSSAFGWTRGAILTSILFSTGLGSVSAPLVGVAVRRFGVRATVIAGLAGMAISCLAAAAMTGALWQLYLAYSLMALLGAGAGGIAWSALITASFHRTRGLALGLALSGTGVSAIVMPQIAAAALRFDGWRAAYLALAATALLVVLPLCAWGLRDPDAAAVGVVEHREAATGVSASEAVRQWRFWLLGIATAATYFAIGGAIPNLVPALTDRGVATTEAIATLGGLGGAIIVGRITVGVLLDRVWGPAVATIVLLPAAIGCVVVTLPASLGTYAVAAVALGLATGMELDVLSFLAARYFGQADYPRIYGRLYMFLAAPAGLAPLSFGYLFDMSGSYRLPFFLAAGLLVASAACLLALGRYPVFVSRLDAS